LTAVSKAELRSTILFEVPPEFEILMQLPVKSPELVGIFVEASKNLKSVFLTIKMQKKLNHRHVQKVLI
jgi:hypothetical protein